jgi:hypothetical protein
MKVVYRPQTYHIQDRVHFLERRLRTLLARDAIADASLVADMILDLVLQSVEP